MRGQFQPFRANMVTKQAKEALRYEELIRAQDNGSRSIDGRSKLCCRLK